MERSPLASSNAAYAFAAQLVRDLWDSGVVHFAVCAGSRSAPLAAAVATTPGVDLSTHVDERSAAFFGLGFARAARAPVALVCTSGTAAANFAPAVAEADRGCVPLILLTADRPAELRDRGAPQTIDQVRLYGCHVRWFREPAPPDAVDCPERLARALAERAVAEATGRRRGPVHLNLPFREPLDPCGTREPSEELPPLGVSVRTASVDPGAFDVLGDALTLAARPVVLAGPWDAPAADGLAVAEWARREGVPVLAEPLAGLRTGPAAEIAPLVSSADAMLRSHAFGAAMQPDLVVRVGAPSTSKAIHRWVARAGARVVAFDPEGARRDSELRVHDWLDAEPPMLARLTPCDAGQRDPGWLPTWLDADKRAWDAIRSASAVDGAGLLPPAVLGAVADGLPAGAIVYLSNSLAVRDAETFLAPSGRPARFLGNRGANGIDGMLSSALGAAASGRRVVLLTGDLAFLHDAGAWLTARRLGLPVTVVALNDGGGGIFDHLPIAGRGDAVGFEKVFRVAHDQALVPIARAFGCRATEAIHAEEITRAVAHAEAPTLVEVRFDPAANLALHREVFGAVERAVRPGRGA